MATIKQSITVGLVTTKDGDLEQVSFAAGDEVQVVKAWDAFYLVKDDEGHYYNLKKELVEP